MTKFIVLYYAPKGAWEGMEGKSEEDHKKGMEAWMAWAERCGEGLVDMGSPLGNGKKVSKDGSSESESNVLGYSVLQAEDMAGAEAMLKDHPHLDWTDGCEIELYECMPMPQ